MSRSSHNIDECIHFANIGALKNTSLCPILNERFSYDEDSSNQDSIFFKVLQSKDNSGSTKSAQSFIGGTIIEEKEESESKVLESENKGFLQIIEAIKYQISANTKKKVVVPSLIQSQIVKNSLSMESRLPEPFYDDETKGEISEIHKKFQSNKTNAPSSNTSNMRRKVRDINWPVHLHPEESFSNISV